MPSFTSDLEKRLWMWAIAVVAGIWSTLGLAGVLADRLRDRGQLDSSFFYVFLLLGAAILGIMIVRRPGWREAWVAIGVAAAYGMLSFRMFISAAERTHLFEYGLVATLIHQALLERSGGRVVAPAVFAVAATALLGWMDEGIQALLPNRVYDIVDVGFNALAGTVAVLAGLAIAKARRRDSQSP